MRNNNRTYESQYCTRTHTVILANYGLNRMIIQPGSSGQAQTF